MGSSIFLNECPSKTNFHALDLIMARGRPKVSVSPCRFCNMQFKRVEHLQRHERIREFFLVSFLS